MAEYKGMIQKSGNRIPLFQGMIEMPRADCFGDLPAMGADLPTT
jgi:hypothetical protein